MVQNDKINLKFLLIIGLIIHISFISFLWIAQRNNINLNSKISFEEDVKDNNSILLSYIESYNHILYGFRGFITASDKVTKEEWALYTSSLNIYQDYPGLKGIAYLPYITPGTRDAFISDLKKDYKDDFNKFSNNLNWEKKDYYIPLQYIVADNQMSGFIGIDYLQDSTNTKSILKAIETGKSIATAPINAEMSLKTGVDYIIFLPIYKKYQPIETVDQRKSNIQALVGLALDLDELIEKSYLAFDKEDKIYLEVQDVIDGFTKVQITQQGNPAVVDGDDNLLSYKVTLGDRNLLLNFAAERYYRINFVMLRNTDIFFGIVLGTGVVALIATYRVIKYRRLRTQYDL